MKVTDLLDKYFEVDQEAAKDDVQIFSVKQGFHVEYNGEPVNSIEDEQIFTNDDRDACWPLKAATLSQFDVYKLELLKL